MLRSRRLRRGIARPLNLDVRRSGDASAMTANALLSYFLIAAVFATQVAMLTLQVRALRRHGHRSFFLLSVATTCGLFYLALSVAKAWWFRESTSADVYLYSGAALLLLTQMAVGVWGTASLFRSYGRLASQRGPAADIADAPNYRLERP
jgi:hypothetical protein